MPTDEIQRADWLDRQWNLLSQGLSFDADRTGQETDIDRITAIRRLHALDSSPIADATRERVWQNVTNRIAQEDTMSQTIPFRTHALIPSSNGHVPHLRTLRPPSQQPEPIRSRRRWWLSLEFAAMSALVAVLVVSLATGGRFPPGRGSRSNDPGVANVLNHSVVAIPSGKDDVTQIVLVHRTLAPGAHWTSELGDTVITLVDSGTLTYSPASGSARETVLNAGSSYTNTEPVTLRNRGTEPAVVSQGILVFSGRYDGAYYPGVLSDVGAQHFTDALTSGWAYLQIDRMVLAPSEAIDNLIPAHDGFPRVGRGVAIASVESGAVTLSASDIDGTVDAIPNEDAATGATTETIAVGSLPNVPASPDDAGSDQPASGNGNAFEESIPYSGDVYGAVAESAGSAGSDSNRETAVATEVGATSGGTVEGVGVAWSDEVDVAESATQQVPTSASGVVESEGAISIGNTGNAPALVTVLTIVPGYFDTADGDPPTNSDDSSDD